MDRPLIILDTETATQKGAPHLLELGAVRVDQGEITDSFTALVAPAVPIDPEATAIHGLTDADVRDAPNAGTVLAEFARFAGDDWLAAHNAGFDTLVLGFECARHGVEPPSNPFIDSLKLAVKCIPEVVDHQLETLVEHFEFECPGRHRALPDAVAAWKVIEECAERLAGLEQVTLAELASAAGSPYSIASRGPRPARLSPRLRPLERAARAGTEVTLLYGDGASAPARLPVLPHLLFQRKRKGYLEAECLQSGLLKTYLLERVQKVLALQPEN